jgi:spore maturation protein CgeB
MRIFQVIPSSTNRALNTNKTWYRNLYEPLIDLGHDVILLNIDELSIQAKDGNFTELIEIKFNIENKKKRIDLFFSYLMDGMIDPYLIQYIKDCGIITCNFSCNNIHQFKLVKNISQYFDFNLYAEKNAKVKFDEIKANAIWWPMASNPNYFKPFDIKRNKNVSFVGANYSNRFSYLSSMLQANIDVQIYGPGWVHLKKNHFKYFIKRNILIFKTLFSFANYEKFTKSLELSDFDKKYFVINKYLSNFHGPISDNQQIELYSSSHISLGFLDVYDDHKPENPLLQHLHLREFEAPMCGALYLTGYSDELCEMFDPEIEVLTYKNTFELIDKAKFYLNNNIASEKIRLAARKRALSQHTYHSRYIDLFKKLDTK